MPTPTIDEVTLADEPGSWSALGFDVREDSCRLSAVEVRLAGAADGGAGILGWSLRDIALADLDGLPTIVSHRPPAPPALTHPNGVVGIDHIVVMSPDLDRSVRALEAAGIELRRLREEPTPAGAPRQAFFRLGREILEVVQEPEQVALDAGGHGRPARLWGLALLVDDLDAALGSFAPHVSAVRDAVQPGRRIATVRRSAGLSVPVALMSRDERGGEERAGQDAQEGER